MGKNKHCTYCLEFYHRTVGIHWGSRTVIEVPGCSKCHSRHEKEVDQLKSHLKSLELDIEQKTERYETDLSKLTAKSTRDLLKQETEYEELLSSLKLNSSVELNNLKAHSNSLQSKVQFLQSRRDSTHGDVVLEVPGLQLSAHSAILGARSAVFQNIVSGAAEKSPRVIIVDDISPTVLEAVVDFCYSGELTFSELVPLDAVFKVAHKFELECLKELCEAELCQGLTVDNVPQMLKLSRKFSAPRLQEEAGKLFKIHFEALESKIYEVLEGPDSTD